MARPAAIEALKADVTTQPVGDVIAITFNGVPRLALNAAELGQLIYGPPITAAEARNQKDRIVDAHRRGEIRGRMAGRGLLIPGAAVVEYLRWLNGEEGSAVQLKTA